MSLIGRVDDALHVGAFFIQFQSTFVKIFLYLLTLALASHPLPDTERPTMKLDSSLPQHRRRRQLPPLSAHSRELMWQTKMSTVMKRAELRAS